MALIDQTIDETAIDTSDAMFVGMDLSILTSDVLSIDPDAIALAASFQYNLNDLIALSDSMFVETTFNTDNVEVSDSVGVTRTVGVVASDSVAATDAAVTGFVRWASPSDSVTIADEFSRQISYSRGISDTAEVSDTVHTWQAVDAILTATLEGEADLQAVLVKKKAADIPAGAPPRVVLLPKPPKTLQEHNVVNPNPPRRRT